MNWKLKRTWLQPRLQPYLAGLYISSWPIDVSEKAMAAHSSTLAWKILWTEEPDRLQSMGLLRVGHNWATSLSLFTFMHWRRKWQPTPVFCLENPRDGGAWWAAIYGVAQSRTRLKWLGSSSSCYKHSCFYLFVRITIPTVFQRVEGGQGRKNLCPSFSARILLLVVSYWPTCSQVATFTFRGSWEV